MDKELLSAIGQLIDEKLKPIHNELSDLRQEVSEVKQEVVKTNIRIEHEVMPRLNALAEGYDFNQEETAALKKRVDRLEERVS